MTEKKLQRILIMAGGTGGHVFPGLAVASYFRDRGVEVHWLGTKAGLEAKIVPEANFPLHFISIAGLRGKGFKPLLTAPIKVIAAIKEARRIISSIKPDVVLGMGGFVSGPGGIASWLEGRPLIIHEQNAKAGLTNKLLAPFASRILEGFPNTFKSQKKVVAVGNPVRTDIENLPPPEERFKDRAAEKFRLLILGGSLGAAALNDLVPDAISQLSVEERPEIWHQTGEKNFEKVNSSFKNKNLQGNLHSFIKDMAAAYSWADMVLCRAGALTIAELCAAGVGAILVPFPHAVDDHQTANAQFMVKNQAAFCFQQSELTASQLSAIVKQFAQSPEKYFNMAKAAYTLRKQHVAQKIYDICREVCL